MNRRVYQNKETKDLKKVWYKKLKDSGFKDIEYKDVLRRGIDWRNYKDNREEFFRKQEDMSSYLWVLEVNAYNNNDLPFIKRRMIIRYLDTLQDKKKHQQFVKGLPNVNRFYKYYYDNKNKLVEFAKNFKGVLDNE